MMSEDCCAMLDPPLADWLISSAGLYHQPTPARSLTPPPPKNFKYASTEQRKEIQYIKPSMTSCFMQIYNHKWGHKQLQLLNQNATKENGQEASE